MITDTYAQTPDWSVKNLSAQTSKGGGGKICKCAIRGEYWHRKSSLTMRSIIIDCETLAKQGDNALGSVRVFLCRAQQKAITRKYGARNSHLPF